MYDVPSSHTIKNNSEMTNASEDIISMIFSVFTISTEVSTCDHIWKKKPFLQSYATNNSPIGHQ